MWALCIFIIIFGYLSSTDPSQEVSDETVADKIDRRPLALQDEDNPKRHEDPTLGKEFLLAVTGQEKKFSGTFIHVSCATDTTINVYAPYVNMTETHHISSGTHKISLDRRLMNENNTLAKKGVHVTADRHISIYVIESYYFKLTAMEGYFALPISILSTEYVVVTDTSVNITKCQFVIAALENKTIVNVTFKTNGTINLANTEYSSGDVFSLEMSRLDTFQVQHEYDLTGTIIQSNKPIAVFSGCECGNGPVGGKCQHEVEQIVPVCSLGQEYITVPLFPAVSYRYRIIAPFSNTIASIQGKNYTMERGTFLEKWDRKPIYIRASKPVMLIEYGQCTGSDCQNGSDPSMITIPAISTFSVNVTFGLHRDLTDSNIQYYLQVTITTDMANKLTLDHKSLNLDGSYTVKTDIWGNYTIMVTHITSGYHQLYHPDTSVRYGAIMYGTGKSRSIGFPLGYNTVPDAPKPSVKFVPTGIQSIKLIIDVACERSEGYEIRASSITGNSTTRQKGSCLPNETSIYNFVTTDLPGTCFNFQILATCGSEGKACYNPFKPRVMFVPTGPHNIKLIIVIVHGYATAYEIMAVSNTSGITYTEKGTFLRNETTSVYNFSTTDLPESCFSFRVVATSGFGQGAGYSEPVIEPNVCYVTGNLSKPVVRSEIQLLTMERNQLVFHCDFDPSSDLSMLYQVTWYRDKLETESKLMSSKHTLYYSRERFRSRTSLPEISITLGMTIFCAISAIQLNITVTSEPYFVGFEVISDNSLKLKDLEETVVYIRLTVPFGCQRQSEECFLGVNIFLETGVEECLLPAAAALSSCGVKISSWRWNQSYPLRIAVKHGQNLHSISRTNNIRFRTDENFYHDFFRNYTLPKNIQVEVNTDTSNLNGKECHAICDPHMQTFDGRKYENQNEGTYILYKHLKSPVQVQMRTNPCYGVPPDGPFCPCGVAIASGRDVFVVDRCSKPIKIYMPQCDDGTLKGKIKSSGNFYQIYLSTGTWVKITSGISFNIYIYPYISDRKSTSGLCGYLDGDAQNDFVLRNGTTVPKEKFEDFNSHWLVKPEEDLFNNSNYKSLPRWPREDYLCMCGQYQDGHIVQPELCSPDTRNFCPENVLNDSLAADCNINNGIKENAGIELDPSDFDVSQNENNTLTEIQTKRNFTKESANFECWSYLNRSLLFKKCSEIPDIHPESFIEICVMDAMLTNTTFWTPTHLDHAQKRCIHQVTVNQPIPEQIVKKYNVASNSLEQVSNQTANGTDIYTANLLQNLRDLACPMNCTGQGDCIKGQCRCYKGYGSEDCSVDMNKAPKVYGIPHRGVCDLQETRCDHVSVLGEDFTNSEHLSCRLSIFQVQVNETRFHDYNSIVVQAQWISFAEVSCRIVDVRSKRSVQFSDDFDTLAIGYRVAVGNTREIFGRNISLLVVDSLCVDCIKAGFNITCTLKDGFDLINKRCIKKMSAGNKTDSGSTVLIISTVVGSVLVMIVVGMLLHYCLVARIRRAQHEKDKKEKAYAELQEINKNNDYYGKMEEVYDEIGDLPDDYASISESVPTKNELK